jgi:uncharacterized protein (DUF983 family)
VALCVGKHCTIIGMSVSMKLEIKTWVNVLAQSSMRMFSCIWTTRSATYKQSWITVSWIQSQSNASW